LIVDAALFRAIDAALEECEAAQLDEFLALFADTVPAPMLDALRDDVAEGFRVLRERDAYVFAADPYADRDTRMRSIRTTLEAAAKAMEAARVAAGRQATAAASAASIAARKAKAAKRLASIREEATKVKGPSEVDRALIISDRTGIPEETVRKALRRLRP
jgi:hypothetical protein